MFQFFFYHELNYLPFFFLFPNYYFIDAFSIPIYFYNYGEGAKARRLQRVSSMNKISERIQFSFFP